ncbi:MAG: hypothetical protein HY319_03890 [Armatimonadetes bacterium]|nr:hypothetical protein [Armatimonadota bacterium]
MRRLLGVLLLLILAGVLAGCAETRDDDVSTNTYEQRSKLVQEWRDEVADMQRGLSQLGTEVPQEVNERIQEANAALDKLANATEEDWEQLRNDTAERIRDARTDLDEVREDTATR